MDDEPKETEGELHAHRSRTTKLKRYEEMLVKGMLGKNIFCKKILAAERKQHTVSDELKSKEHSIACKS